MLIKCYFNYFCQGYKKKLEIFFFEFFLLMVIYKSFVCQVCDMYYFFFENKKKFLKY